MNLGIEHAPGLKAEGQKSSALSSLRVLVRPPVVVGAFLLLYALLGLLYYNQQQEQDSVSAELARVQRILRKVPQAEGTVHEIGMAGSVRRLERASKQGIEVTRNCTSSIALLEVQRGKGTHLRAHSLSLLAGFKLSSA